MLSLQDKTRGGIMIFTMQTNGHITLPLPALPAGYEWLVEHFNLTKSTFLSLATVGEGNDAVPEKFHDTLLDYFDADELTLKATWIHELFFGVRKTHTDEGVVPVFTDGERIAIELLKGSYKKA